MELGSIIIMTIAVSVVIGAIVLLLYARRRIAEANDLLFDSKNKWKDVKREIENERRESALKIKDEIYKKRSEFELDMKRERVELDRLQNKLNSKYESIESKDSTLMSFAENFKKKSAICYVRKMDCV